MPGLRAEGWLTAGREGRLRTWPLGGVSHCQDLAKLRGASFLGPTMISFCLAFWAGRLPHVWVSLDLCCRTPLLHTA